MAKAKLEGERPPAERPSNVIYCPMCGYHLLDRGDSSFYYTCPRCLTRFALGGRASWIAWRRVAGSSSSTS
ncbi:MAG: hypothetical protein QXM08_00510 [Thermofilaceae archaeon]